MNRKITKRIILIIFVFLILSSSLFAPIYFDTEFFSGLEELLNWLVMIFVTVVIIIPMVIIAIW